MPGSPALADALARLLDLPAQLEAIERRLTRIEEMLQPQAAPVPEHAGGEWMDVAEAAAHALVKAGTIRAWVSAGMLPAVKPAGGRRWRVRRVDLDRFLRGPAAERVDLDDMAARVLSRR